MKNIVIAALAFTALAPLSAHAQQRMSDARYLAASQCLAYAALPQLQADGNFDALRDAARIGYRSQDVAAQARDHASRARATARSLESSDNGLAELRERRNELCESFVQTGLVQLNGGNGASAGSP